MTTRLGGRVTRKPLNCGRPNRFRRRGLLTALAVSGTLLVLRNRQGNGSGRRGRHPIERAGALQSGSPGAARRSAPVTQRAGHHALTISLVLLVGAGLFIRSL